MAGPDESGIIRINYLPRPQFVPFHNRTQRFACIVAHRRAGKTVACVHDLQRGALRCENVRPRLAYISPFLRQSKAVAWDYLREACAPLREIGATVHESELRVDYPNGGQVRLYGADNPDALRGIYLDGVVLDEFADMDPRLWANVIRPALADRKGWAVFIGTPKGRNEFYSIWQRAQSDPDWFAMMLRASETRLIDESELELAKRDLSEDQYAQEFECSFDAAIVGSYYGKLIREAEEAGRVCGVPYDPAAQVWTAWDIGIGDQTAIWFAQMVGREVHLIDFYMNSGPDSGHYAKLVLEKPYSYGGHILPHDAESKEKGSGKSYVEFLTGHGLRNITVAARESPETGINAAKLMLPRCWFDKDKTAMGLECLKLYRREYDEKRKAFKDHPLHDWTSDAADAFRYLAMSLDSRTTMTRFHRKIVYQNLGIV